MLPWGPRGASVPWVFPRVHYDPKLLPTPQLAFSPPRSEEGWEELGVLSAPARQQPAPPRRPGAASQPRYLVATL